MSKWVYTFGNGAAEGDASMRNLLGGKGANFHARYDGHSFELRLE